MTTDTRTLADLVTFARMEVESGDIAPWADLLRWAYRNGGLTRERTLWAITLYNTYDAFDTGFGVLARWPSPQEWRDATDRGDAQEFMPGRERRNLYGGKVLIRLAHYCSLLGDATEDQWLSQALDPDGTPGGNFDRLAAHTRQVWGVGRQAAFEWAEFLGKVLDYPVMAEHAHLWESEGPRRSLQRLYGNHAPTAEWLDARANETQRLLASHGIHLDLWDFETVICDFNVMRSGRYYPGKHLAALRAEIDSAPGQYREILEEAWRATVPGRWAQIQPGVDKGLAKHYARTGRIREAL